MRRQGLHRVGTLATVGSDRFAESLGPAPTGTWRIPGVGSILYRPRVDGPSAAGIGSVHHHHHQHRFVDRSATSLGLKLALSLQLNGHASEAGPRTPRSTRRPDIGRPLAMPQSVASLAGRGSLNDGLAASEADRAEIDRDALMPSRALMLVTAGDRRTATPSSALDPEATMALSITRPSARSEQPPRPVERVVSSGRPAPAKDPVPAVSGSLTPFTPAQPETGPSGRSTVATVMTETTQYRQLVREVTDQVNRTLDRRVRNQRARLGRI